MPARSQFPGLLPCLCLCALLFPFSKASANTLLLTARYLQRVHKKVQAKWNTSKLPIMELHKRSVTLTVWIGKKGSLLKLKVGQSSGLKRIDRSILAAARKAAPFPAPPAPLQKTLTTVGMDITFRPQIFKKKLIKGGKRSYRSVTVAPRWSPRFAPTPRKK